MNPQESIKTARAELEAGIALPKCQKCGCMDGTLRNLAATLPTIGEEDTTALAHFISESLKTMRPIQYACLGCDHCFPAVAQNALALAYPALDQAPDLTCEFRLRDQGWPVVAGEYTVLDRSGTVALSTLASVQLADEVADRRPNGLAIVGKTETENIGIDKVIKNVVTSPTIRHLIVAGADPEGHLPGRTLLALSASGVDETGRVIGSLGKRPFLRNVSSAEVEAFREQVQLIDMIGCEDLDELVARIQQLSEQAVAPCGCAECGSPSPVSISSAPKIVATEPTDPVDMDKAGYFVITPLKDSGVITVEHYAYDNTLLRLVEGSSARAIYSEVINHGWVTNLSHAAYLGKELARAELSLQHGPKYVQDGA